MKVTKFPQSCMVVEKDGRSIVIDPGSFFTAKYSRADLGSVEAALYTHQHSDHLDIDLAEALRAAGVKLYGNADVVAKLGGVISVVESGKPFEVAGFHITPHDIDHFIPAPNIVPPPNTGYIIYGNFFHPGDGYKNNGVDVSDFAAPIGGPFDYQSVVDFIISVGAKRVVPIHFSNQERYPIDPDKFVESAQSVTQVILLQDGESTEL